MSARALSKNAPIRTVLLATVCPMALVTLIGCGSESGPASTAQTQAPASQQLAGDPAVDAKASEAVVSQFLDRVRRGGEENSAMQLLTSRAQSELTRIGHQIQPIGSPDARYTITRSQAAPDTEPGTARLVHTVWTEPIVDPASGIRGQREYQVVWGVNREAGAWRISGLVLAEDPQAMPIVLDFENGEQMALFMSPTATPAAVNPAPANTFAPGQAMPMPQNPAATTAQQQAPADFYVPMNR